MSREDLLTKALITVGDHTVNNVNVPQYSDIILQVLPECIEFEDTGYSLTFQANVVDFGTGSTESFLLTPQVIAGGDLRVATFNRDQLNRIMDFLFIVEGRYKSFWSSFLMPVFQPVVNGPALFPELMDDVTIFGNNEVGQPRMDFYALNWSQDVNWNNSSRILAVYSNGYKNCYWTRVTACAKTVDPRILKVTVADAFPAIEYQSIDVITEYVYMRLSTDEIENTYTTSEIAQVPMSFVEDYNGIYNPWTDIPPNYPEVP